jgi:CRP-like cAMP-binding protein
VAHHPFFKGMSEAHLEILAECAERTEFAAGEMIFRCGEEAGRFYLIEEGSVSVEVGAVDRGTISIQTLGAGDELGWSWLFPPFRWHFDACAVKPTRAIYFYGSWLRELCQDNPEFGGEMMRRMAQVIVSRLQAAQGQLIRLSTVALDAQYQALRLAGKDFNPKRKPTRPTRKKL